MLLDKKTKGGNASWHYNFCNGIDRPSYFRVRSHLLREKGNGIGVCLQVLNDYPKEMKQIKKKSI